MNKSDDEFIIHSRNDIPALLARIDSDLAEIARLRRALSNLTAWAESIISMGEPRGIATAMRLGHHLNEARAALAEGD